jgi:hypothetical protein
MHAYGPADDIPGLLAQAEPDPSSPVWDELWSRLCHQGTVYSASFAALPMLTDIAGRWSTAQRSMPLVLAGAIVSSADQQGVRVDPHASYRVEIAALRGLTEEALQSSDLAGESGTYVHMLMALLAFEGVKLWSEQLDGLNNDEYEVACPRCGDECFVAFGEYGAFTTQDSMYMRESDSPRLPLVPAAPAKLPRIGRRLHDRAIADGHPDVATKLTYVFGHADCPACGKRFRVDKAVAAMWGD